MSVEADSARTGRHVARNTAWNLVGALLPVPVALVCIPVLVGSLGVDRFGVLGVAWMVMGYFGMFDFGLGLSTTRFVAAEVASQRNTGLRGIVSGSLLLHTALGLAGGALFAILVPWLTERVFTLPPELTPEARVALYWLAASVPAIVVTAALRGALEGLQRFDAVNLVRIPASVVNYAGPVIALSFGTGLPIVIAVIVLARFAVLAAYAVICVRMLPPAPAGWRVEGATLLRLATYGGWLTISNLVNPIIISADRFVIAAAVSVAAVTFYVTPYEIITKGWILSASLLGALFPVLSALATTAPASIRATCRSAELYLLCLAAPAIAVLLGCADVLLDAWLGNEFAEKSTVAAHFLAVGILVSIVAQVPLTALNAIGRADVTAKIAAVQLPIYAAAVWYGAERHGITGVAAVWAARAILDAFALFLAAHTTLPKETGAKGRVAVSPAVVATLPVFLAGAWSTGFIWTNDVVLRFTVLGALVGLLVAWEWKGLLRRDDREKLKALLMGAFATRTP